MWPFNRKPLPPAQAPLQPSETPAEFARVEARIKDDTERFIARMEALRAHHGVTDERIVSWATNGVASSTLSLTIETLLSSAERTAERLKALESK